MIYMYLNNPDLLFMKNNFKHIYQKKERKKIQSEGQKEEIM